MSATVSALRFKDKVVIVTGGVQGIGRGIVDVFAENGGKVVVFDIQDDVGSKMKSEGPGEIIYMHCDMTKEDEIKSCIQEAEKQLGKIDCLVNNVGFHPGAYTIDELSVQGFKDLLQLNLISYFTASKYALPYLRKSKGNIVNISSIGSAAAFRNSVTYVATKGGITSFTKALAIDEAKYGVRVNAIAPGAVETPLLKEVWPADELEKLKTCHVLQKIAQPREIGLACLFLVVDATFTTGEQLMCTGGSEIGYGIKNTGLAF
ncbi:17-beta-hydroxysteroid dehydrogenase 14-like [Mercenaria mercenaria]|uniref:17-beta-hydroxysteroid dehydrogenase 14-like n=1 Tax=Mercenaria mercenaria TaxID=6596 RepID=UPI00234F4019|nr:17-beta-hydroxysteroid dehydrogenase 14-like [Mercenaria mercenaria]XP_045194086.2 17-beta-hydroxysteroid dehydrogenase 14-like [Mercenaria mercenaria]